MNVVFRSAEITFHGSDFGGAKYDVRACDFAERNTTFVHVISAERNTTFVHVISAERNTTFVRVISAERNTTFVHVISAERNTTFVHVISRSEIRRSLPLGSTSC